MKCICANCGGGGAEFCFECCSCGCVMPGILPVGHCCYHDQPRMSRATTAKANVEKRKAPEGPSQPELWYDTLAKRGSVSKEQRQNSRSFLVRNANNAWKRVLIGSQAERMGPNLSALDMCCGRGGDMTKWKDIKLRHFTGCDVSAVSLEEAKRRFSHLGIRCPSVFEKADMRVDLLPARDASVDLVSCQFALHYLLETSQSTNHVLKEVSRVLRDGGLFFATVPNEDIVEQHMKNGGWKNSLCSIVPVSEKPDWYSFSLIDAVEDVHEPLVRLRTLKEIAATHGLEWDEEGLFLPDTTDLTQEAKDVVNLYRPISFKRSARKEN